MKDLHIGADRPRKTGHQPETSLGEGESSFLCVSCTTILV